MTTPVERHTESVWDYPRPPGVQPSDELVVVRFGGTEIVRTTDSVRILETSHPPTYYLPRDAFAAGVLRPAEGTTVCEFKGRASYCDIVVGDRVAKRAAWYYPNPNAGYEAITDHLAVMPASMDECTVDGERVTPQEGGFYGGWITSRVVGPFKGAPGTLGW